MNKMDLIRTISDSVDMAKSDVEKVINSLIENIVTSVKDGQKIAIAGLGSFEKSTRAERVGINPSTKAKITIPAKSVPKFKAAKYFKDEIA